MSLAISEFREAFTPKDKRKGVNQVTTQAELFKEARVNMKDTQCMPSGEKQKVLRQWGLFLKSGLAKGTFTELLYHHLIQHCSFIAHYDRQGFYATYFEEPKDTVRFLSQFDNRNGIPRSIEYHMTGWYTCPDYNDINAEMCRIASRYIPALVEKYRTEQQERDVLMTKLLLAKHGLKASIES
jgi:hypothetical protein